MTAILAEAILIAQFRVRLLNNKAHSVRFDDLLRRYECIGALVIVSIIAVGVCPRSVKMPTGLTLYL